MGALFTEENLIIPLTTLSANAGNALECDSFSMAKYQHATIVIIPSASITGDNVLTVECGATDSADSGDATFHYRLASAAIGSANCDVLAADATASTLTLTAATYQGKMLILELDADELPGTSTSLPEETTYPWVTVDFDGAADTSTVAVIAILSRPRYAEAIMDTALA